MTLREVVDFWSNPLISNEFNSFLRGRLTALFFLNWMPVILFCFFLSIIIIIIILLSLCYKLFLIISLSLLLVCWWLFHCYFFSYLFLHFYCYRRYNQSSCSSITELFVTLIHFNYSSSSRSAGLVSFLKSNLSYLTFRLQNNLGKKYGTHPVLLSYFTHRCPSVKSNCFVLNSFADLRTLYAASYDSDRVVLYNSTTGLTYTLPGKRNEHPGDGMSFICFILLLSPGISFLLFLRT